MYYGMAAFGVLGYIYVDFVDSGSAVLYRCTSQVLDYELYGERTWKLPRTWSG
jgi:hypothetical protein